MITNTTNRFWFVLLSAFAFIIRNRSMRKWFWVPLVFIAVGFLLPQNMIIPVENATIKNWDEKSFWAYPWGTSITHKGIDIFAAKGTAVISSTNGIVIYTYEGGKGGKSVMMLGPKWRFHYYAHLNEIKTFPLKPIKRGSTIGTVGDTGNAIGKPPHLHYAITSPFPYPKLYDSVAVQGWKKMFHLNPDIWLRDQ
ncbi:M23 family metallopeptidase [Aurantibacter crassamenti]|uniref:M23 family metallopeptidase n=1 Tax=Aurantibacter crassamenti TaxID=1837375 RepID=UPI001939CC38|nr:M23 family metallopeptidase [Aurantibacter crassamenti]MBM1107510.1 M23 family metallopeptidase [Aurantibacter crassamenti]